MVEIGGFGDPWDGVYQLYQDLEHYTGCMLLYVDGNVTINLYPHKVHGQQIWRAIGYVKVGTTSSNHSRDVYSRSCSTIFGAGEIPNTWPGDPHTLTIL